MSNDSWVRRTDGDGGFWRFDAFYHSPAQCTADFVFGAQLGQGTSGSVFCADIKCETVVKVVPLDVGIVSETFSADDKIEDFQKFTREDFEKEADLAALMGEYGVGPRVFKHWVCETGGFAISNEAGNKRVLPAAIGFIVSERF